MKLTLPTAILLSSATITVSQPVRGLPTARHILDTVVARLPKEPLLISGDLKVRKRRGLVVRELKFETLLRLGAQPPSARYTISDSFGKALERLTVVRPAQKDARFEYAAGDPSVPADLPDLTQPFQDTDISWMDLSLGFLWWGGARRTGDEEACGRDCYVVEVEAPEADGSPVPGATQAYAKARLWIDKSLHMLLRAEALNGDGEAIRRLWVRSFKKIDERWMIKDMEVQQFPVVHRTRLSVREVSNAPPL